MDAVILAAGQGRRLGHQRPKCLVEVGGRPLIQHQLDALAAAGIERVTAVVGYQADAVRRVLPPEVETVENEDYATTNSLYSFALAEPSIRGDVLVANADVLFHPAIARWLTCWPGSAIAYDSQSGTQAEEMKLAILSDGRLERMSKTLPAEHSQGENLGLLALTADAARATLAAARRLIARGRLDDWLASAVNLAARTHALHCLDVAGLPWVEIDFPDDLERARRRVLPAIGDTAAALAA